MAKVETSPEKNSEVVERRLPSPSNLGEEWTAMALEAISQDFRKDRYSHNRLWKDYWRKLNFAKENWEEILAIIGEETWEMCLEGLPLLGL